VGARDDGTGSVDVEEGAQMSIEPAAPAGNHIVVGIDGSEQSQLAEHATCPVLVVHGDTPPPGVPGE
jgi:hypothetical protein